MYEIIKIKINFLNFLEIYTSTCHIYYNVCTNYIHKHSTFYFFFQEFFIYSRFIWINCSPSYPTA